MSFSTRPSRLRVPSVQPLVVLMLEDLLEVVKATDVKGIVINPFGSPFLLGETMIDMIFEASKAVAEQEAKKAES